MSGAFAPLHPSQSVQQIDLVEFLQILFGQEDVSGVHVCSFEDKPGLTAARWAGSRMGSRTGLPAGHNCYVCIAELKPGGGRSLGNIAAHHMIVADDVGTKVNADELRRKLGDPTFAVETSPGNQTWYYVLGERVLVTEVQFCQWLAAIRETMKRDGLTDPGTADGVRYVRPPVGVNSKQKYQRPDGSFPEVRLVEKNEGRVVWLSDVAQALMGPDWQTQAESGAYLQGVQQSAAGSSWGADRSDPLVRLADDLGMDVRQGSGPGKLDANCPNMAQHEERLETGFAFLGNGLCRCQHGSCAGLTSSDFRAMMVDQYDERLGAQMALGLVIEDGEGTLRGASGTGVVPGSGLEFLARASFEQAGLGVGAGVPSVEDMAALQIEADRVDAVGRAATAAKRESDERELEKLAQRFVYVMARNEFYDVQGYAFLKDAVLERHPAVVAVIPPGGSGMKRAVNVLLNHPAMRTVYGVSYAVGDLRVIVKDENDVGMLVDCVNTWTPSKIGRRAGRPLAWFKLLDFVLVDGVFRDHLLDWLAWVLQNPRMRTSLVPLIIGGQGIGKDLLFEPFVRIMGSHNVESVNSERLAAQFNEWQRKRFVMLTELKLTGDGKLYNKIKEITSVDGRRVSINEKFTPPYSIVPRAVYAATTNHMDAIRGMESDDRRWSMYESPAVASGDPALGAGVVGSMEWFKELAAQITSPDELERVHEFLMTRDVSGFNALGRAPDFGGTKQAMIEESLTDAARWVVDELTAPGGRFTGRTLLTIGEIVEVGLVCGNPIVTRSMTSTAVRDALKALGCANLGSRRYGSSSKDRVRLWSGAGLSRAVLDQYKLMQNIALGQMYIQERDTAQQKAMQAAFGTAP